MALNPNPPTLSEDVLRHHSQELDSGVVLKINDFVKAVSTPKSDFAEYRKDE